MREEWKKLAYHESREKRSDGDPLARRDKLNAIIRMLPESAIRERTNKQTIIMTLTAKRKRNTGWRSNSSQPAEAVTAAAVWLRNRFKDVCRTVDGAVGRGLSHALSTQLIVG
jgi:hypothetical protein